MIKYILIFSLIFGESVSHAGRGANPPQRTPPVPVPKIWTQIMCERGSKSICLASNGLAWLHRVDVWVDPLIKPTLLMGWTYTLAAMAPQAVGVTAAPELVFVLTVSRAGLQAGSLILLGGAVVVLVGTIASSITFLLATTVSTAGPEVDEPIRMQCRAVLAPFKGDDGIEKLQALTPEEMEQILPCIPMDKDLNGFLSEIGKQGQALENQIHAN